MNKIFVIYHDKKVLISIPTAVVTVTDLLPVIRNAVNALFPSKKLRDFILRRQGVYLTHDISVTEISDSEILEIEEMSPSLSFSVQSEVHLKFEYKSIVTPKDTGEPSQTVPLKIVSPLKRFLLDKPTPDKLYGFLRTYPEHLNEFLFEIENVENPQKILLFADQYLLKIIKLVKDLYQSKQVIRLLTSLAQDLEIRNFIASNSKGLLNFLIESMNDEEIQEITADCFQLFAYNVKFREICQNSKQAMKYLDKLT
jgi:hypothetical protein